jgi:hypothetical protein
VAAKKKLEAKVRKLEAKVRKLKAEVDRADGKTARWRKKSKQNDATIASLEERLARRDKQLSKARRAAAPPEAVPEALSGEDIPALSEAPPDVAVDEPVPGPDGSWTVVRLRAEARSRGLTGMSGKTKAELLAALT